MAKQTHVLGIMSGTSMDGVDCVLARIEQGRPLEIARSFVAYGDIFRAEMLALNLAGPDEMHRAAVGANGVARLYAQAVEQVLGRAGMKPADIAAIGAHGQTVRHRPELGYTVQLLNGALLAELTGIPVICDFRSRDIAAGGQGAPLVPAFHAAVFADAKRRRAVLNLGGIANVTLLAPGGNAVLGFDCGPANVLLDFWCERHTGARYDADGAWAAGGTVLPDVLAAMLAEPFFQAPAPKSTGRDLFSPDWLARFNPDGYAPRDVQATLLELTAGTCAQAMLAQGQPDDVMVCGGGAFNSALMARLAQRVAPARLATTAAFGMDPMSVEALAFAWLAWRRLEGLAGNLPSATGAQGFRLLGAVHG